MKHALNIFAYDSYREFLRDLYLLKKKESKGFSHRVFIRVCGFNSPNFLKLVIEGKRNLGKKAQDKIIESLCNNRLEKEYLGALINFEQAKTIDEKNENLSTIARLRHRKNVKVIDIDQYEYLSKWNNVAIRELVALDDFNEDAEWINSRLGTNLSTSAIKNTIQKLITMNLLKRDEAGRLTQTDMNIVCDPRIFSVAVNNYHKEMLVKASEAIEKAKSANRDITALTVATDRATFERIVAEIKKCREQIHHLASEAGSKDVVYQICFQAFNLSKPDWKQKKGASATPR